MRKRKTQAERRQQSELGLQEAAGEIIAELGYNAATFGRIGEKSGYAASLVTSRFGSKDGLFLAMIDYLSDRYEAYFEQRAPEFHSGKERVIGMAEAFMTHLEQDPLAPAYYILLATAIGNKLPQKAYFLKRHKAWQDKLKGVFLAGLRDGSIATATRAETFTAAIGCLQLGLAMQFQIDPSFSPEKARPLVSLLLAEL